MQREVIRVNGAPVVVKLDHEPEEATEGSNQFGPYWQYICNDNANIIFPPKEGHNAILKSGARAGDLVQIRKTKRGKTWLWDAECVSDAAEPSLDSSPRGETRAHRSEEPQQMYQNGVRFPKRSFANPQAEAATQREAAAPVLAAVKSLSLAAQSTQPSTSISISPDQAHPLEELMVRCFAAAMRVNWKAFEQVTQAGREMEPPNWEDVRTTAHSFFIEVNKRNGGSR